MPVGRRARLQITTPADIRREKSVQKPEHAELKIQCHKAVYIRAYGSLQFYPNPMNSSNQTEGNRKGGRVWREKVVGVGAEEEKRLGYHDAIAIYLPIPTCVATIIAITIYLF